MRQKVTLRLRERTYGCLYTLLYGRQTGPTVEHTECCSMLWGSLDGRGVWGRMAMCI